MVAGLRKKFQHNVSIAAPLLCDIVGDLAQRTLFGEGPGTFASPSGFAAAEEEGLCLQASGHEYKRPTVVHEMQGGQSTSSLPLGGLA